MGVYRGALLDLHKNRLARKQKAEIAKQKAEKDELDRAVRLGTKKPHMISIDEDGKYMYWSDKGDGVPITKDQYDQYKTQNAITQRAQQTIQSSYGTPTPPTLQKQREDYYNTEAEKFKAQETDSIKSEAEFARRKAEALKNKPVEEVVNKAVVDPSIQPNPKHLNTRKVFPEKPMKGPSPLERLQKGLMDRAQLITGTKDPNKVASQTMTPNIMSGQNHPKATNLLTNNNVGGMVVGQAPNTGIQSIKQGAVLADPNFENVKVNPFRSRQDSMYGGKFKSIGSIEKSKPTQKYIPKKTSNKLDLPSANVVAKNNTSSITARPVTQQDRVDKANKKNIGNMDTIWNMLLKKDGAPTPYTTPKAYPQNFLDAISGMVKKRKKTK